MASNAATNPSTGGQPSTTEGLNVGPSAPSTSTTAVGAQGEASAATKKKKRRKKTKANRRQSFAAPGEPPRPDGARSREQLGGTGIDPSRPGFYRLGQSGRGNLSDESLNSEALLDHRDYPPMRTRRDSRIPGLGNGMSSSFHAGHSSRETPDGGVARRHWGAQVHSDNEDEGIATNSRTPLLGSIYEASPNHGRGYGLFRNHPSHRNRSRSNGTSTSSKRRRPMIGRGDSIGYDVNNPPSVPGSPKLGPDLGYDDVMVTDAFAPRSPRERRKSTGDQLIDIDGDPPRDTAQGSTPPTPRGNSERRHTLAISAEGDVCFPVEGLSEIAEEDYMRHDHAEGYPHGPRRRRAREWPDLSVFEAWSVEEKEVRSEGIRAKKISEPVLVGGRLRPLKNSWHRTEEDAPFRYTYFNEEFQSTIHSQTISELAQPGQTFRELFIPEPPELSEYSSEDDDIFSHQETAERVDHSPGGESKVETRQSSIFGDQKHHSRERSGDGAPAGVHIPAHDSSERPKRYGAKPTFWLDVLSPTDTEMRVLSKAFGIHPLTAEDIMMQEAREKVELFRNYYFVNYRTFEQDVNSEDYLEPVNMYVIVFRDGVISFHFSMTPHPANVRRRIRQLKDYLILSSDWISYAIIDDITDVFAPLIQSIEDEVDEIDDAILELHQSPQDANKAGKSGKDDEKRSNASSEAAPESGGDMLRRVGQARKKVMGLYRLLGNKADVIKGFAKRCNEQWEIAPRSEIGLYLGDIQDHILTMTSNLSHYETLLSRAHSNYLAQINIRMNERQEQTADVLGKLTVLGTIVLPMNIITGMWGMNTLVPGQGVDNLNWFWSITAGLLVFGISCFFIAKRVYGIV